MEFFNNISNRVGGVVGVHGAPLFLGVGLGTAAFLGIWGVEEGLNKVTASRGARVAIAALAGVGVGVLVFRRGAI